VQVVPEQQPFGQFEAQPWQAPSTQGSPAAQVWQVLPPLPQAALVLPAMQTLLRQQPLQEVELHTHWPPTHA
jgi:hypothetical protein